MKKLRIGLIGCGGMGGGAHAPSYDAIENIEIVAFCDIKIEKAQALADKYGVKNVFENYLDLINMDGIDAVGIATPNYLHSTIAVAALERGLHVLCEKPDAINTVEAQKMKDAAEKSGKTLMVIRNNRFMNVSKYTKEYIEAGKMGEVYAARCGWQRRRGIPGKGGWFTTKAQSGGGPLIDLGVHMIDLTMWLMGNPKPVAVTGCTYSKFSGTNIEDSVHSKFGDKKEDGTFDVEDLAMGFIRFDNGATLQVECSWASNIEQSHRFFELRGTKGGTSWRNGEKLRINTEDDQGLLVIEPTVPGTRQIHEENLRHFADVLLNGAEPMFVPEQGLNMIKILEALYKSAECGHEIIL